MRPKSMVKYLEKPWKHNHSISKVDRNPFCAQMLMIFESKNVYTFGAVNQYKNSIIPNNFKSLNLGKYSLEVHDYNNCYVLQILRI